MNRYGNSSNATANGRLPSQDAHPSVNGSLDRQAGPSSAARGDFMVGYQQPPVTHVSAGAAYSAPNQSSSQASQPAPGAAPRTGFSSLANATEVPAGVCRFFAAGDCKYATACWFSHDIAVAPRHVPLPRPNMPPMAPGTMYPHHMARFVSPAGPGLVRAPHPGASGGHRPRMPRSHGPRHANGGHTGDISNVPCRYVHSPQGCRYGDKCRYRHGEKPGVPFAPAPSDKPAEPQPSQAQVGDAEKPATSEATIAATASAASTASSAALVADTATAAAASTASSAALVADTATEAASTASSAAPVADTASEAASTASSAAPIADTATTAASTASSAAPIADTATEAASTASSAAPIADTATAAASTASSAEGEKGDGDGQ